MLRINYLAGAFTLDQGLDKQVWVSESVGFLSSPFHCLPQRGNVDSAHDNCN
jgi:hypothetical protein